MSVGVFWRKLKRVAVKLPFAEDLLAAYLLRLRPRRRRATSQAALLGARRLFFILPFDFVPDMLPVLGFTDDAAVAGDRAAAGRLSHH